MKPLIIGLCTILVYCVTIVSINDNKVHERQNQYLKYVCDTTASSAASFYNLSEYSEGRKVFNQVEGNKVIEDQMKDLLRLDDSFMPLPDTYWQTKITYKVYYFDDSNTTYPYPFVDQDTGYTKTIYAPTIVVTMNAGRARYRIPFIQNNENNIRSGAYEWEPR